MMIGIVDIGSNSIRTMTAANDSGSIRCSDKQVYTTRLAEGLLASGALSEARMRQSLSVIAVFASELAASGVPVFAYATSAVRDASNRDAFVAQVRSITGGHVAVLTGEQEARYAFAAATCGMGGGMLDIGGGSTQIVSQTDAISVPLGCVRAKDICPTGARVAIRSALYPALTHAFANVGFTGVTPWSGVGGTITTLGAYCLDATAYDKHAVSGARISYDAFDRALCTLDAMGDGRAAIPLLKRRYDVILHGGTILLFLMERLQIRELRISDADGMEGYAAHIFETLERT